MMKLGILMRSGMLTLLMWVVASVGPIGSGACCQEPGKGNGARGIWDVTRAVAPQPFEERPLYPIRIPDWVQETLGCGYTLSNMTSLQREAAAAHGVTISELGFVDPFYAYYDSKLLRKRSPHVPAGRLERDIAEYQRLKVRILAVYPPCLQSEVYENHPEWRRIDTNTDVIPRVDLKVAPHGGMLCLLGPYGDFFIDVLAEILTLYPQVDAFSFDGLHYGGVCYCGNCRAGYRKATGEEIPNADLRDPKFRRYQHWADRRMESLVQRMQNRLKAIKPDVALVTWTTNAGRFGHFLSIPRNMPARMNLLLDAPDQEFWLDETNRGASIVPAFSNAYLWSVTNHRVGFSEPYLMSHGNPYGKESFPPEEILRRMLLVATYGAQPSLAVGQPGALQAGAYRALDEIRRRGPWLTKKRPEPWAALVMSDNTRNFYGRESGAVEERYLAEVFGWFRAMVEEHLPVTIINDWNLNSADLKEYALVILPNTACLDPGQILALHDYVRNGGGLIATLDAGLCDAYGNPHTQSPLQALRGGGNPEGKTREPLRPGHPLGGILGIDHLGAMPVNRAEVKDSASLDGNFARGIPADYWEKRKDVYDLRLDPGHAWNTGKLQDYVGADAVTLKGPAVRVMLKPHGAATGAPLLFPQLAGTIRRRGAGDASEAFPAVVASRYGVGRSAYFAAGVGSGYYLYPYPYQRLLMRRAVTEVASRPQPVVVQAPMCVHANLMRRTPELSGKNQLILHLYNDLNTTAFHAKPDDDVPLREEVVPIHDITVTFASHYRFRSLRLEPDGAVLPHATTAEGTRVTVPRLDIHAMVVGELE